RSRDGPTAPAPPRDRRRASPTLPGGGTRRAGRRGPSTPGRRTGRPPPVRGAVNPQARHLVFGLERATAVEAPVDHLPAKHGLGSGGRQGALDRRGIVHPRLHFQLVVRVAHSSTASSTRAVSARVANTCAAPAARSAATP